MSRVIYQEQQCKSALNRVTGMPFAWSLNPYRGCVHACHYCYARATHAHFGLDAGDDFSHRIFVKVNLPAVLRQELARPSWNREVVAIGTATDAWQPVEAKYRLARQALEAFRDFQSPVSIVTKAPLIERDLDLLQELHAVAGVRVYLTITTLAEEIWRRMEPGTASPARRLETVSTLAGAGIRCGVLTHPVLPGLTDDDASIEAVAAAARAHGARTFSAAPLRLAPLVKEHYLETIEREWPELASRYRRLYSGQNVSARYAADLRRRVDEIERRHGFAQETRFREIEPANPPPREPRPLAMQLALIR